MADVEQICRKASTLDAGRLQTLAEFLDFLLTHQPARPDAKPFPATTFESPDAPSIYGGPALTQGQMRDAIDWEAGGHK
jgi:hypothetical protein